MDRTPKHSNTQVPVTTIPNAKTSGIVYAILYATTPGPGHYSTAVDVGDLSSPSQEWYTVIVSDMFDTGPDDPDWNVWVTKSWDGFKMGYVKNVLHPPQRAPFLFFTYASFF